MIVDLRPSLENASWFAIQTFPKHEKMIFSALEGKNIAAFLPLYSAVRKWSDRRKVIQLPLFPGYVFVRIGPTPHARGSVLQTNGVISFVGVRGIGTPIPDEEIVAVQNVLNRAITFAPHPYLTTGQRVRIRGGSLEGLQGVLTAVNRDQSLVVSVELIQRSIAIRVTGYRVEPE
jgi:transcription antitermination factor NusG